MPMTLRLFLDTPVTRTELRGWLSRDHGFALSGEEGTEADSLWLRSDRGSVIIGVPDPSEINGPFEYEQPTTLEATLYPSKGPGAYEFLDYMAGDILQRCPGDAVLAHDTGPVILVRRGETVWVDPDPFTLEHLFAGTFRPAKLVHGLPPPATPGPDPYADDEEDAPAAAP